MKSLSEVPPPNPNQGVTIKDVMMKLDSILTRTPMKLEEVIEQMLEARQITLGIFQNYEKLLRDRDAKIKELEAKLNPQPENPVTKPQEVPLVNVHDVTPQ